MVQGVDAVPVQVEATCRHAGDGTPRLLLLAVTCVGEAYLRVLQAVFALDLGSQTSVLPLTGLHT